MRPWPRAQVVAGEQGHDHEALHGHGQVLAHHLAQLVGLALEAERHALDLLVVLELGLEEPDHLHGRTGRPGDGHRRVAVGGEDLLHGPVGDDVALGGPPVAGHDHAVRDSAGPPPWCRGGRSESRLRCVGPGQRGSVAGSGRCADEGGEAGARVVPGREERQAHRGYSPPFWT